MSLSKNRRKKLMDEIVETIGEGGGWTEFDVGGFCDRNDVTVNTAYRYLKELLDTGRIEKQKGKKRSLYKLPVLFESKTFELAGLREDSVWRNYIQPKIADRPKLAIANCAYAFTEIVNNAIDHSDGTKVEIDTHLTESSITIYVIDDGVGIFKKIAASMELEEERFAILELAKGKFTTDPESHTGEGIFFSSKIADAFMITSGSLTYYGSRRIDDDNAFVFEGKSPWNRGTLVMFEVRFGTKISSKDVFQRYTDAPEDYGFSKTIVPVRLLEYGEDDPVFVSRSQAKRLLVRFERFQNIHLDFSGVDSIGQAFADEVFRVFRNQHPGSRLTATNCSEEVRAMINRVEKTR